MNWEAIGAIGEILGATAVVATLFFLAIQIRASNALAAAERRDRTFEQMSRLRHLLASNPDLARIWRLGCLGESLSEDDYLRFNQVAYDHFLLWRSAYHRAELAGQETMVPVNALVRLIRDPTRPALEPLWREYVQKNGSSTEAFTKHVERLLSESGT